MNENSDDSLDLSELDSSWKLFNTELDDISWKNLTRLRPDLKSETEYILQHCNSYPNWMVVDSWRELVSDTSTERPIIRKRAYNFENSSSCLVQEQPPVVFAVFRNLGVDTSTSLLPMLNMESKSLFQFLQNGKLLVCSNKEFIKDYTIEAIDHFMIVREKSNDSLYYVSDMIPPVHRNYGYIALGETRIMLMLRKDYEHTMQMILYKSVDGGYYMKKVGKGLPAIMMEDSYASHGVNFSPAVVEADSNGLIYMNIPYHGIYYSRDTGYCWHPFPSVPVDSTKKKSSISDIAVDGKRSKLYAIDAQNQIWEYPLQILHDRRETIIH